MQGGRNYFGVGQDRTKLDAILERIVEIVPQPKGTKENPLQALIFDSVYDDYQGVVAYVRVVNGQVVKGDRIKFAQSKRDAEVLEVGVFEPKRIIKEDLKSGEIGYVVTGIKEITDVRVGDTVIEKPPIGGQDTSALAGYRTSSRWFLPDFTQKREMTLIVCATLWEN